MIVLFAWHRGSVKAVLSRTEQRFDPAWRRLDGSADFRIFFGSFSDLPASFLAVLGLELL
jgi:hypothetical protein